MRVLVTSVDWTGHVFPMVPVGWALGAAGHDVRVLCSTAVAPAVGRAGLTALPLLEPTGVMQARMNNATRAREGSPRAPGLPGVDPFTGGAARRPDTGPAAPSGGGAATRTWLRRRRSLLENLVETWRPDLVLHDLSSVDGRVVADLADVPAVCHLWGLVADAEEDPAMDYRPERIDPSFADWDLRGPGARITHVIDPTPDSLEPPTHARRLRVRYVPYNGTGGMPPWVLTPRRRPRVVVVWGTSVTRVYGPESFHVPRIVQALADLDLDVVLAIDPGDMRAVGTPPGNARLLTERTPLSALLEGCDAIVHNGAAGCAMTALAAGVPQLAVSVSDEQAGNAVRIAAADAGRHLPGASTTAEEIRAAVRELLADPAISAAARRLAA
jgi:UDP:flavonoid glycosyltransferase YjiC (YdhE family)